MLVYRKKKNDIIFFWHFSLILLICFSSLKEEGYLFGYNLFLVLSVSSCE